MNRDLHQPHATSLLDDAATFGKLQLNFKRNKKQDQTDAVDAAAAAFRYDDCKGEYWNPEEWSLLYGTPLWQGADSAQRVKLNQLFWVAYYSQIVSAEIATIFLNQTSASGLYGIEDFRLVCDTLDLESAQERAHVHAFKTVSEEFEAAVFGERVFTYPMRTLYTETMIFSAAGRAARFWKQLQLGAFGLLSSGNAFIACQYFTVRGVRTLNGKIVQHQLAQYFLKHPKQEQAPVPARISYLHFLDESYHFNSSTIISHDVLKSLREPSAFERWVANLALWGCQRDHFPFSAAINGIFWYDPALLPAIYKVLRSSIFRFDHADALAMLERCFGAESEGLHRSQATHEAAVKAYEAYLAPLAYVSARNKTLALMRTSTLEGALATNRAALRRFARTEPPVLLARSAAVAA